MYVNRLYIYVYVYMYVCMYVYAPVNIYIYVNRLYSYEHYMSTYDTYAYTDVYIYIMYTCTLTSNKFNTLNKEPQSPSVCTDMTGDGCMSTSYLCIYVYIYTHIYHKVSSVCLQELEAAAAAQKAWFRDNHRMYMFRATGVTVVPGWARFFCYFIPSFYQPGLGEQRAFSPGCRCCA